MKLYISHDPFEVSFSSYDFLFRQFARLNTEVEKLSEPKIVDESMPLVAYYFNL